MLRWRRLTVPSKDAIFDRGSRRPRWNRIFRILYILAAVFVIATLWLLYTTSNTASYDYLQNWITSILTRQPSLPVHLVSISTRPLPAIALLSIDSIAKYMPNAAIYMHFSIEENIPSAVAKEQKDVLARQIQFFKSKGVNIKLVFHDDFISDIKGTPLEGINITQRHIAGYYGVKPHQRFFAPHASDYIRGVIMFKHGGLYLDYNHFFLRDLQPLFNMYGPNILIPENNNIVTECKKVELISSWIAMEPKHLVMEQYLINLADVVKKNGADWVLPWDESPHFGSGYVWNVCGSAAITAVHVKQCGSSYPPLLVNEIPESIAKSNQEFLKNRFWNNDRYRHEDYTLISRKYLMPMHWDNDCVGHVVCFQNLHKYRRSVFNDTRALHWFNKDMKIMQAAYQIHVFGDLKSEWVEFAENRIEYPLFLYVHEKACKHLCDAKLLRKISEGDESGMRVTNSQRR